MQLDDQTKKAADLVSDNAKQLITVAAGIMTFTLTFYEKFKTSTPYPHYFVWLLVAAWVSYLGSMWSGLRTIDALIARLQDLATDFTVLEAHITKPAFLQRRLFLLGTALVLVFGAIIAAHR